MVEGENCDWTSLPCRHSFHESCIRALDLEDKKWLRKKNTKDMKCGQQVWNYVTHIKGGFSYFSEFARKIAAMTENTDPSNQTMAGCKHDARWKLDHEWRCIPIFTYVFCYIAMLVFHRGYMVWFLVNCTRRTSKRWHPRWIQGLNK